MECIGIRWSKLPLYAQRENPGSVGGDGALDDLDVSPFKYYELGLPIAFDPVMPY